MSAPVLVTGGTGFLGSLVVEKLAARGREVHVLARASSDRSSLAGVPVRWHDGDLTDAASVARAVEAVAPDGDVVHSGALISYRTRDAALQEAVNVGGTQHVLDACRRHRVRRLVHVSSVVAVAHGDPHTPDDESAVFNGSGLHVDYVTTKRAAEDLVSRATSEFDLVIVNPGAIFGPTRRATSNSARLLSEIKGGKRILAAPPGGVTVVGVEDTAEGTLLALEKGVRGRRYILGEGYLSFRDLISHVANECGQRPVRRVIPKGLWNVLRGPSAWLDRVFPMDHVTPQSLKMLGLCWNLDGGRARRELGWNPRPARQVLSETLASMS